MAIHRIAECKELVFQRTAQCIQVEIQTTAQFKELTIQRSNNDKSSMWQWSTQTTSQIKVVIDIKTHYYKEALQRIS